MEPIDQILDAPADAERHLKFAGFWIRTCALLIDLVILMFVISIVSVLVLGDAGEGVLFVIVFWAIIILYFSILESSGKQATFGKQAVRIKVGKSQGEKLSFANALGRSFGKFVSQLFFCIGFMMVGWDSNKQGIHDKLANTYVYYA
ncbi:RDD family protein [Ohtaekwangia koreensis]|uniref:Uncharacterized membrane protein YckC, RDD family n=1 Tax=Ohtaekwangia koreensis TaxID=688867 RepID=A0A1T5J501_9BACT|nr:RDD family protein [Ohtaekwangia koreensis]SKC46505.1 Uncharacterized membrane protein YckC, RDD family [Ohtaekwangia koreensis]